MLAMEQSQRSQLARPQLDCGAALQAYQAQEDTLTNLPAETEKLKIQKHSCWSPADDSTHCGFSDEDQFGDEADQFSEPACSFQDEDAFEDVEADQFSEPACARNDSIRQGTERTRSKESHASTSIRRRAERAGSKESNASSCLDSELRIALARLIRSESAEPFLCDCSDLGLLDLRMIEQRLDAGRYADAKLFWSDIDACFSLCASAGRHPSGVWEMRALYQQLEQDFWKNIVNTESFLDDMSPALRSVATSTLVLASKIERCLVEYSSYGVVRETMEFVGWFRDL